MITKWSIRQLENNNPFTRIRSEKGIKKLAATIIANTEKNNYFLYSYWVTVECYLLRSLIGIIYYTACNEEKNISTLLILINYMKESDKYIGYKNVMDFLVNELEEKHPHHFVVNNYQYYKRLAGEQAQAIVISCCERLTQYAAMLEKNKKRVIKNNSMQMRS